MIFNSYTIFLSTPIIFKLHQKNHFMSGLDASCKIFERIFFTVEVLNIN